MRLRATRLTLLSAVFFLGCESEPTVTLELVINNSDPAVIAECQLVLETRFNGALPSILASVESSNTASQLVFKFMNAAPDSASIDYLYKTPGRFSAYLVNEDGTFSVWFTEQDIEYSTAGRRGDVVTIQVQLDEDAGRRVMDLSSQIVGRIVRSTLDGRLLLEAKVMAPFGRRIDFTAPDADKADLLAIILSSGPLPAVVSSSPRQNGI